MRLFNLSVLLSVVMGITFPILQSHYYVMYRELGMMMPRITITLLSPWVPGLILFGTLSRVWIHANLKNKYPSTMESILVITALFIFLFIAAAGFGIPFFVIDGPLGKDSG